MWQSIAATGQGEVVASSRDGGLARFRRDGALAWEVQTDHAWRDVGFGLRAFSDGQLAVAGRLSDEDAVIDGISVDSGALVWRVTTPMHVDIGAIAAFGERRYIFGCGAGNRCSLSSVVPRSGEGWSREVALPGVWNGTTLWAIADGVIVLGNHGAFVVSASDGEIQHRWSALGRVIEADGRVIWLALPGGADILPGEVVRGASGDRDGLTLLAWRPGSDRIEVLGHLPHGANLVSAGRHKDTVVVSTRMPGPRMSVFGLSLSNAGETRWYVELPEGEHDLPSTVFTGWLPLAPPADGELPQLIPMASFDDRRRFHLRWIDLDAGRLTGEIALPDASDLEVRRDGDRYVVFTPKAVTVYDLNGREKATLRTPRPLVQAFRFGQVALAGETVWFVDGAGELARRPLQ